MSRMTKAACAGCHQNFYNGNNGLGVRECWSFKTARMVRRKEVSIHQVPPWTQKARLLPSCYQAQGYIYVAPDKVR